MQGFDIFILETGLILLSLYLALAAPDLGDRFFRRAAAPLLRLAHRPILSLVAFNWSACYTENRTRAGMLAEMNRQADKLLIMVRYAPGNPGAVEWVYNEADIDSAKVVWARELERGNEKLVAYFRDRRVFLLEPDVDPTRLSPYPPPN